MKEFRQLIQNAPLFRGITVEQLDQMLSCLDARRRNFSKNEYIYQGEDSFQRVCLVLSGSVCTLKEDQLGNRTILTREGPGELVGECFAGGHVSTLPISLMANEPCELLLLDYRRMVASCPRACPSHAKMIENMVDILALKNLQLTQKMEHITKRTTKEKLLSYLSEQAQLQQSAQFTIPFNREQLASYLCVERTAMCAELSKLRKDGVIRFRKNEFTLTNPQCNKAE